MNIGPLAALLGSAAGQPAAQANGSETERAQQTTAQAHRLHGEQKAAAAAGLGATDADSTSADERDADGRLLWEDRLDLSDDARRDLRDERADDDSLAPDQDRETQNDSIDDSTTGGGFDITV